MSHSIRHKCDSHPVILGFPVTKEVASLYVFLLANGGVWGIQVVPSVAVADTALLCTVYAAVHYLSNKILFLNPVVEPLPFKDKGYKALGNSRQP